MSILKVGDGKSDVGIGAMSFNFERQTFVDYTFPTGIDGMVWVSKPPQQLPQSRTSVSSSISLPGDASSCPSFLSLLSSLLSSGLEAHMEDRMSRQ